MSTNAVLMDSSAASTSETDVAVVVAEAVGAGALVADLGAVGELVGRVALEAVRELEAVLDRGRDGRAA